MALTVGLGLAAAGLGPSIAALAAAGLGLPIAAIAAPGLGLPIAAIAADEPPPPEAAAAEAPPIEDPLALPGPALRAAVEAMERGEDALALERLEAVAAHHPIVADHADLLRLEILARGDDPEATAAAARAAVARHPKSPLAARLQARLGDALLAIGDEAGARAAFEVALARTERRDERTRIEAALAASQERAGRPEAAAEAWLEIWRNDPLGPEGDRAEARLREIEAGLARSLRTGLDHRARGDALRLAGQNEMAVLAYDDALAKGDLQPRNRRRTMRSRAQSLFAIRRYDEAIEAWGSLAPDPDSRVERARSIARAGDVPAAIAELEKIAGEGWGRSSVHARYLAALLLEDEDEIARARRHFERVAGMAEHPRYADPALWYLGWTAWRQGDAKEARDRFAVLETREADEPIGQLRARYWRARAREALGDDDGAAADFARIAGEYPFSYYGWRAGLRVPEPAPVDREPLDPGRRALQPADLARGRILLEAGLVSEASIELLRTAERAGGVEDRIDLGRLLAEAGEHHRAQGLIVWRYATELARGPAPEHEALWRLAWPEAYGDLVRQLSPDGPPLDPALVSAVMREESGYRPAVTSPAGARGLLQIMPETGQRLAEQLGLPAFAPDDLYRPRVNIQLGSFYLQQLAGEFDGRLEAAIASYNAGPQAAARWTEEQPSMADDEWVEAIPYSQTRAYVKRVLRSVHVYRELY
ncbi:MAG TPA: lytic transglycosylase domain-containing protein [Myxococcota bacterium]|nr:lytic transglycosylase domain-containing protein [Myxococcota bacterium]